MWFDREKRPLTILHVESDPLLAEIVKTSFDHFGFQGEMINARSATAAADLLDERRRKGESVSLIISGMRLPDGTGLDVIREVKRNPAWRMTPVVVLSHSVSDAVINDAYALGANSYVPETGGSERLSESLENFYHYWLENARLPAAASRDRLQEILERAVGLRIRTSEFYLALAGAFEGEPREHKFWLDRALSEGNLSNLLSFLSNKLNESDLPPEKIDQLASMQIKVKKALKTAEKRLRENPAPRAATACRWALELAETLDEEAFAEGCGYLFPKSPIATAALKARASAHMKDLALHALELAEDSDQGLKAVSLYKWAERMAA